MTGHRSNGERIDSPAESGAGTVQLLLADDDRRTRVRSLLADRYDLVIGGPVADADLFVVGPDRFREHAATLRQRTADRAAFSPVLLLRGEPRSDEITVANPAESDEPVLVDAVLDAPLEPDRLRRRVHSLLVRRRQSLALLGESSTDDERRSGPLEQPDHADLGAAIDATSDVGDADPDGTGRPLPDDRYAAIFNWTYQCIGLLEPDGTVLDANEAALEFGGLERDEVVGRSLWEADWFGLSESLREQTRRDVARAADGEFVRRTVEVQAADGTVIVDFSIRPVRDDAGAVKLLVPEAREITAFADRERELRRYERRFEAVFQDPKMLVGLLEPDGTIVQANETALGTIDSSPEEIVGEPFWDAPWWPADARADVREWVRRAADGEYVDYERDHVCSDDDTITVTGTIRPVTNADGKVVSLIVSAHDITERKRRERELERTNDQLERFASIVSHDLRNPLNVLAGSLDRAEATGDPESFEHCREAIDRMDRLIDDLLTLARQGERVDSIDTVDLGGLAETCWRTVETGGATLRFDSPGRIRADESRCRQLLENLLRNAIEHGGEGVTVTIGGLEGGFYVEDDGPGIPPDERERVFRGGYTTATDGTGLGLAIVTEIADAHGWDVRLNAGEDGGARFEFTGVTEPTGQ